MAWRLCSLLTNSSRLKRLQWCFVGGVGVVNAQQGGDRDTNDLLSQRLPWARGKVLVFQDRSGDMWTFSISL